MPSNPDPPRPCVLHVILTLERAGAQEVLRTLSEHHARLGWRSVVATFEDGDVRRDLERAGVTVVVLGPRRRSLRSGPLLLGELRSIERRLRRLAREHGASIVQTHLLETLDFLALRLRSSVPPRSVVWTIHNSRFLPAGRRFGRALDQALHRWLYRRLAPRAGALVAVSADVERSLRAELGSIAGRVVTIPNAVDADRLRGAAALRSRGDVRSALGLGEATRLLVSAGRMVPQKGQEVLIDALPAVLERHPDSRLVLAGEGPLRGQLEERVRRLCLEQHVDLPGTREDLPALLAAADAFVLPSRWEGLSIVLLEALALGVPTVTTDVPGSGTALLDGQEGWLVQPDDPAALARALVELLDDPRRARARGRAARARVEREHGAEDQARRYLELYRDLLDPGPLRATNLREGALGA